MLTVGVGDAAHIGAGWVSADSLQRSQRPRHQALATRLVDCPVFGFDDAHRHPGQRGLDGGRHTDRSTSDHDDVGIGVRIGLGL